MALPGAAGGTVLAPGTSSFGWEALQEDLSKYFAPSSELGIRVTPGQAECEVPGMTWQGWENLIRALAKLGRKRDLTS